MSLGAVLGVGLAHYQQGKLTHEAIQKGLLAEAPLGKSQARRRRSLTPPAVVEAPKPIPSCPYPDPRPINRRSRLRPLSNRQSRRFASSRPKRRLRERRPSGCRSAGRGPRCTCRRGCRKPSEASDCDRDQPPSQRAFVFRGGKLWDSTRVSTGKPGKRTPVGTYSILEKAVYHRSNKYSNAPMPYMQRITWGGVALHAGVVPGYPASHGCIRLPSAFAKKLYAITNFSSTVVVTDKPLASSKEAHALSNAKPPPPGN